MVYRKTKRTYRRKPTNKLAYLKSSYIPRSAMKPERKFYSSSLALAPWSVTTIDTAGTVCNLSNAIVRGTDRFNRIGSKIAITSVWMRLLMVTGDATNSVRAMLFTDNNPSTAAYPSLNAFADLDRLKVYKDKLLTINDQVTGVAAQGYKEFHYKFRRPLIVQYTSGTDVAINPLLFYLVSDSSIAPHPSIEGPIIINYIDA